MIPPDTLARMLAKIRGRHGIGGFDPSGAFCMIAESDTRRGARQQYARRAKLRRRYALRVRWYRIRDGNALELEPYTSPR